MDLGTTNSVVAILEGDRARVVENIEGERCTPSVVAILDGFPLVGVTAKRQAVINPKNTFYSTKRLMETPYTPDLKKQLNVEYDIVADSNGMASVKDETGVIYSPSKIASFILLKLKETAEAALDVPIKNVTMGVPSYFTDAQRKATKDAAELAGLNAILINEPTAAVLAYGVDRSINKKVFVYDLGGGTFDASIIELRHGSLEVQASASDLHLGGIDFDKTVYDYLMEEFKKKTNITITDPNSLQKIRDTSERVKMELSTSLTSDVQLPYIAANESGPVHMEEKVTRSMLEKLTLGLITKTVPICQELLKQAQLQPSDIDDIVLCGGQTRMPKIIETVKEIFGKEPVKGINPDELVAVGAAFHGTIAVDGKALENVAIIEVTSLDLGIETLGGIMYTLIPRNTTLPAKATHLFSTSTDNQHEVEIKIVQGNRPLSQDNILIGKSVFGDIPPAPKGHSIIELTIEVSVEGLVNVSVKNLVNEKDLKVEMRIVGIDEEIEKRVTEATDHKKEDLVNLRQIKSNVDFYQELIEMERILLFLKEYIREADFEESNKIIEGLRKTIESGVVKDLTDSQNKLKSRLAQILDFAKLNKKQSEL